MSERIGANGMPMKVQPAPSKATKKKKVTPVEPVVQEIVEHDSDDMLQEILEINPNKEEDNNEEL